MAAQDTMSRVLAVHHDRDGRLWQQCDLAGVIHDSFDWVWRYSLHSGQILAYLDLVGPVSICAGNITHVTLTDTCFHICLFSPCSFFCSWLAGCCLVPFWLDRFKSATHRCPKCGTRIQTIKKLWGEKQLVRTFNFSPHYNKQNNT